ncbi:FabD/lysophospholipase-like protein [Hortaea werneckii]|nr:FabD/lysophospholipase-like protein [Hortaea werneckii]
MEENGRLRRKDTTKGPPLRILCLDGGGVRGYSMLIILQELMHRTFVEIEGRAPKRHEIPKPCDHFDLIAGTGTGGLIALMLGRLRLDLDTCKDVYVRLTRRAFETDKTFAGIPYKSTMFKASKLEEVIKACVREHTVFEDEGNDLLANATPMSSEVPQNAGPPGSPQSPHAPASGMGRSMSQSSRYSQMGMSPMSPMSARMGGSLRWGNANADLYDTRENRTKTAVTAVLKGTKTTTLLRSYDSRKEPAPDVKCAIWQAGRATAAIALAFKPVQIGQSVYLDDGGGTYNPSPLVLDEAVQNEWPGREVGVFVSIGTGKRPPGTNNRQHEWWEGFLGGSMGEFAEARRRLINKLEGCEQTHQFMLKDHLIARGVNVENYYRLNVEVGVGEFGMNEWARLSEISTMTRTYLAKRDIENINQSAAVKLAKIQFAKVRHDRAESRRANGQPEGMPRNSWDNPWDRPLPAAPPPTSNPMAVELPADDMYYQTQPFRPSAQREHERSQSASDEKIAVIPEDAYPPPTGSGPQSPNQRPAQPGYGYHPQQASASPQLQQQHYSPVSPSFPHHQPSVSSTGLSPRASVDAPPLPPKTPLPYPDGQQNGYGAPRRGNDGPRTFMNMGELGRGLPYPDVDGPPPVVNTASKPSLPSR